MNTCRSVDSREVAWNWSGRAILWRTGIELGASGEETMGDVSTVFYYCQLLLFRKYHSNETGGSRGILRGLAELRGLVRRVNAGKSQNPHP